jgi:hypothetical protein
MTLFEYLVIAFSISHPDGDSLRARQPWRWMRALVVGSATAVLQPGSLAA